MKRFCKTLLLKDNPDLIREYIAAHAPENFWPEIAVTMRDHGITDMEIYIDGNRLFMIMETVPDFDHDKAMAELAKLPVQAKWEKFVSRFQATSPEATASEKWKAMKRIFKLPE